MCWDAVEDENANIYLSVGVGANSVSDADFNSGEGTLKDEDLYQNVCTSNILKLNSAGDLSLSSNYTVIGAGKYDKGASTNVGAF